MVKCAGIHLCAVKGKAWKDLSHDACRCWRHVQSAHIWVCSLPFTLLSLNSVRSFCSVCPASPIATGSIVASYSTWHQQWHASRDKSFQAFPHFFVLQARAWRPGNEANMGYNRLISADKNLKIGERHTCSCLPNNGGVCCSFWV